MTDPVPPKKATARKWLFWGCGCGGFLIVWLAAVFGYVLWQVGKGIDAVGDQGAVYLASRPEVSTELGPLQKVESISGQRTRTARALVGDRPGAICQAALAGRCFS